MGFLLMSLLQDSSNGPCYSGKKITLVPVTMSRGWADSLCFHSAPAVGHLR